MNLKELSLDIESVNFIGAWFLYDTLVCDKLINFFNKNKIRQEPGRTRNLVIPKVKDSTDLRILPSERSLEWQEYEMHLREVSKSYIEKFPCAAKCAEWWIKEPVNIQYYKPNQGYHEWHSERLTASSPLSSRHLVFMTYLNDVSDQGETEFLHQNIKVKPEKGLTLIWPADWTHYHRGIASPSEEKYIITGWFSFNF